MPFLSVTLIQILVIIESVFVNIVIYNNDIISPASVVFHQDLISPIQYVLSLSNQSLNWLLSDGRPMSVKTARDSDND